LNKFIALVGMTGSGKSVIADELIRQGYKFFRFGQITIDILKEKNLEINEKNEKEIREGLRKEHGMAAYAIMNIPKIEKMLEKGNVVGDGLYSWSEYKILKEKYKDKLIIISVYSPPNLRYERLENRKTKKEDKNVRNRPLTEEEARSRDEADIENIEKGGPIAMADYTLVNTGTIPDLLAQLKNVMKGLGD